MSIGGGESGKVKYLDVPSEAFNLLGDFRLETENDAHRQQHNRQTDGHTGRGYRDGQARGAGFVGAHALEKTASYEKREFHPSVGLKKWNTWRGGTRWRAVVEVGIRDVPGRPPGRAPTRRVRVRDRAC